MNEENYTATITVDRTPHEAFAAINNVRGWWSETIEGDSEQLGDVFLFHVPDAHRCTMTLTEVVPDRKVVWHVSDSYIKFAEDTAEWEDTEVVFEISETDGGTEVRFTHVGLVPAFDCFDICSNAWGAYITSSLRNLITTGQGDPFRKTSTIDSELRKHAAEALTRG